MRDIVLCCQCLLSLWAYLPFQVLEFILLSTKIICQIIMSITLNWELPACGAQVNFKFLNINNNFGFYFSLLKELHRVLSDLLGFFISVNYFLK